MGARLTKVLSGNRDWLLVPVFVKRNFKGENNYCVPIIKKEPILAATIESLSAGRMIV